MARNSASKLSGQRVRVVVHHGTTGEVISDYWEWYDREGKARISKTVFWALLNKHTVTTMVDECALKSVCLERTRAHPDDGQMDIVDEAMMISAQNNSDLSLPEEGVP